MKFLTMMILAASHMPLLATAADDEFSFAKLTGQTLNTHEHMGVHGCEHKPGAQINVSGREFFNLQRGQLDDLSVDLTGIVGEKISVQVSADTKGLALQGPQQFELEVDANQLASFSVPVKALLDGRWVINLIVQSQTADGEISARAMALVVQVGNMVALSGGQQKATQNDAQGAPIIVLPAQEEIL
ncbi:MAG TPA: hypothetical protein VIZ65_01300 [Cellvibrionaceae bacterium]